MSHAAGHVRLSGAVCDAADGSPLPFCSLSVMPGDVAVQTDADGRFYLAMSPGHYEIKAVFLGYETLRRGIELQGDTVVELRLVPAARKLDEVVITAKESEGLSSGSRIGRDAMQHLQPTSFTDLLELIPGNVSKDPSMGSANTIALRETGNLGANGQASDNPDYAMSSLGTLFIVDGAPIGTDANLQTVGTSSDATSPATSRSIVNRGVDMRAISTDNIESVEIVRGIPSAEYGNLTSGMVNIKRVSRPTPLTARFKADEYSKLLSVGKGFTIPGHDHVATVDLGWLDSKVDPRDNLENYRRLTASARMAMNFYSQHVMTTWRYGVDFTGSFDDAKTDPDLSLTKIDEYKSSYRRLAFNSVLDMKLPDFKPLSAISFTVSASYQFDRLTRRKQVAPSRASIAPSSMSEGVSDGYYLLGEYVADYMCDGKPVDIFAKLKLSGSAKAWQVSNDYKVGAEWSFAKNYGRGQVYDLTHPLSASWTTRPRAYRDIPALQQLSFFVEDNAKVDLGNFGIEVQAGLRTAQLLGLDSRYDLAGKVYLDPRVNMAINMPEFELGGRPVRFLVAAGYGLTTKMPTIDYLYPQDTYNDFIQLNYYDINDPEGRSRVNLRTYIDSAVNYELRAARNTKRELRIGAEWGANRLSVTYFNEKMNSGYRYTTVYVPYAYRKYDATAIDATTLTGPPSLEGLPYEDVQVLDSKRQAGNGTRIDKQGVEFQLNTARWQLLRTSLTVTGAWFRTVYSNSQMLYSPVSEVIDGESLSTRYVGIYDSDDGRVNEQFNTNFMFDTQIPGLGLIFSTNLQCMWWVKTTRLRQSGIPAAYVSSVDGVIRPFDYEEAASDPMLSHLVKTYNEDVFRTQRIPTALYVNFKATKTIGRWMRVALFVNRIIDYLPDYTSNGLTVRRSSDAYFGMELNFTL